MVTIILLNWNGWRDTIECLESVLRLDYPSYRVIVCDNASSDGSMENIAAWADGKLAAESQSPRLEHLSVPPITKPVAHVSLAADEAAQLDSLRESGNLRQKLILVETGANLGFAGGNNIGLRLALAMDDTRFVWLLNNDTVVEPDALSHLVRRLEEKPGAGICGSTLLYYGAPGRVQALGGSTYNRWLARIGQIGNGQIRNGLWVGNLGSARNAEAAMKYVVGASMLLRRELLETVGLLNERYFLYFDELDLATRAQGRYTLAYAPESFVYHKEGASIGTSTLVARRPSALARQYASQNRILFTRLYFPAATVPVVLSTLASAMARLLEGRVEEFLASLRGMKAGLLARR